MFALALLYSALIALIGSHLRVALIALPIWIALLWYAFWKWNLLRFTGYLAVVPISILAFEIVRTLNHPPIYAYDSKVLDRSHYKPGLRAYVPRNNRSIPGGRGWGLKGVLIGKDGFRADCEDLGPYLDTHTLSEGKNPYFIDNRHFSAFGTRLVAEHYLKIAQKTLSEPAAN